jgi:hypothetical protein
MQVCSYPSQSGLVRGSVAAVADSQRSTRVRPTVLAPAAARRRTGPHTHSRRRSLTAQLPASAALCEYRSNRYSQSTGSLIYLPYKSAIQHAPSEEFGSRFGDAEILEPFWRGDFGPFEFLGC